MTETTQLINKTFGSELVRLTVEDDDALFVAKDVCETLGYKRARDAVKQHCKGAVTRRIPTSGGKQDVVFIPESDVYRLTMGSKLPSAEKFKDWVCEEVLPEIRKTGSYTQESKPQPPVEMTGDPILDMLKIMSHQREEMIDLKNKVEALEAGSIPVGWNTIGELSRTSGISKQKVNEIIALYSVGKKRIPQAGEQRITHVNIANESEFFSAVEKAKSESQKIENSDFFRHEKLGRFAVRELVS